MTSSNIVVKSVAKKLKYYFEVKRLEDGFDLSNVNVPTLDHPPLKARSALQYDGLHDRPLKHYFSQPEVRVQLTQLGLVDAQLRHPRERVIKKSLVRGMKKHHFLMTAPDLPPVSSEKVNHKNCTKRWHVTKKSNIPECYYVYTPAGRQIHPSLVGFGGAPKSQKNKALKGGWPVLRSAPPVNIPRGEAERLVNSATKLLAATETIEHVSRSRLSLNQHSGSRYLEPRTRSGRRRPLTAKYTYDINGHRVPSAKVKAYDDSYLDQIPRQSFLRHRRSSSPDSTTATEESSKPIVRPSPRPPRPPTPPSPTIEHAQSAKRREHTVINLPSQQIRDEVRVTRPSPRKYETGVQTERHLLDDYDHNEEEVKDGPWGEYQVHIKTGDRIGASSSADVNITIYGEKGCTPPIKLTNSKHNKMKFQRGKEDLFVVAARHVGKMKKIKIGHDRSQLNYAWYLENVMIYDMNAKKIYDFPCERWLSGQDDDHRTYRTLPVDRTRSFVDALEKADTGQQSPRNKKKAKSDSETSDTESDSSSHRKDRASMRPKHSQRSRRSSSSSSTSTSSSSGSDSEEEGVIQMSAPSTPRDRKKDSPRKDESLDQNAPGTVIQFKKKDSQTVEEEVVLNQRGADRKPQAVEQEYLAGYKAGLEAVEATERRHKVEERMRERQLLSGPSIHDACRSGDLERVKVLLDKFPEMKDFKDESGWTPLHLAAGNGHVNIIKWLTSAGRDDLDVETPTGYTPTHVAAMNGHINAVMVLNAMGADLGCKTVDKQTPLHLAARAGHLECVKWLVANGAEMSAEDSFGRTALYLADEYGQTTVVDFLRVCERDLANPNSTFAQMHRAQQKGGSVALPTIKEDDKASNDSDYVQVGNNKTYVGRRSKAKEESLQEKRTVYKQQHQHMEEQGASFLDSIRQDLEHES
ncbi:uncharacterized protein [Littorina saxatilis]|uniref:uncharacterized protein isoform X3 n=1 Tax=Littorina saxatilis TaxID=31220 RepID=UPI0038B47525